MSNERIDQIINQMWDAMPFARPLYAQPYIREAMQQYGAEQYQKGRMDQEKVEDFKLNLQLNEVTRLRKLVQAQKDLIKLLEISSGSGWIPDDIVKKQSYLRIKIKSLEQ